MVATVGRKRPDAAEVNQEGTSDVGDNDGGVKDDSLFPRSETSSHCNILVIAYTFTALYHC